MKRRISVTARVAAPARVTSAFRIRWPEIARYTIPSTRVTTSGRSVDQLTQEPGKMGGKPCRRKAGVPEGLVFKIKPELAISLRAAPWCRGCFAHGSMATRAIANAFLKCVIRAPRIQSPRIRLSTSTNSGRSSTGSARTFILRAIALKNPGSGS